MFCKWVQYYCMVHTYRKQYTNTRHATVNHAPLHSWWRHQMETFSALLAICAGNSPVPGEFPAQRPVTRSFDIFVDLRLNKRLSKQSWSWWFETLSCPLWRHSNVKCLDKGRTCIMYLGFQCRRKCVKSGMIRNAVIVILRLSYLKLIKMHNSYFFIMT